MSEGDPVSDADLETQREVLDAFTAAARDGNFEALLEVLDPDVVLRADFGSAGESREVRGARLVAGQALFYARQGLVIKPALVNGTAGAVSILDGEPFAVGGITVRGGKIVELDILADLSSAARSDDPRRSATTSSTDASGACRTPVAEAGAR